MIYSILFRHPLDKLTTLFETDDRESAGFTLEGVVLNPDAELIGYSDNLNGVLDDTLSGVKLFPAPVAA